MDRRGTGLVAASAAGFGVMAILAKDAGGAASVTTVLTARFLLAAVLFWPLAAARGLRPRHLPPRAVLGVLALGAGYAVESSVFLSALHHVDASIASLVLCTYPALVLALGVTLGRERADGRRVGALAMAIGGTALVLAGHAGGALDATGLALTLTSTVLYAAYVALADTVTVRLDPLAFGALLCTGAGAALAVSGTATGRLHPGALTDPAVAQDVVLMATLSTVAAVAFFFAGMRRIGPTGASIVAGIEPVITVALAAAFLGETLTAVQVAGGLIVLGAVSLVRAPAESAAAPAAPRGARLQAGLRTTTGIVRAVRSR